MILNEGGQSFCPWKINNDKLRDNGEDKVSYTIVSQWANSISYFSKDNKNERKLSS